ncbi:MAG: hypothetical protein V3V08_23055 [Nannocystaceae bacterium]
MQNHTIQSVEVRMRASVLGNSVPLHEFGEDQTGGGGVAFIELERPMPVGTLLLLGAPAESRTARVVRTAETAERGHGGCTGCFITWTDRGRDPTDGPSPSAGVEGGDAALDGRDPQGIPAVQGAETVGQDTIEASGEVAVAEPEAAGPSRRKKGGRRRKGKRR